MRNPFLSETGEAFKKALWIRAETFEIQRHPDFSYKVLVDKHSKAMWSIDNWVDFQFESASAVHGRFGVLEKIILYRHVKKWRDRVTSLKLIGVKE